MPSQTPAPPVVAIDSLPSDICVERYKCFQQPTSLPLRPLTLIFGRNNEGKSALLRLLPLLADSAHNDRASGLNLSSKSIVGARFRDLLSQGLTPDDPSEFSIKLSWPDDILPSVSYHFKASDQGPSGPPLLDRVTLCDDPNAVNVTFQHQRPSFPPIYTLIPPVDTQPPWTFDGLTPRLDTYAKLPDTFLGQLKRILARLTRLSSAVHWLHAVRASGDRYRTPSIPLPRLLPNGSNAVELLHANPSLQQGVNGFFTKHFSRALHIEQAAETGQIYAKLSLVIPPHALPEGDRRVEVLLNDCGEGPQQCLPVLVALELLRQADDAPAIVAIEEPESHLHPSLQQALAQHICEIVAAANHSSARVILETHSQHFLLGVQLAVAQGQLSPDLVSIQWVQQNSLGTSYTTPVTLDSQGLLSDSWPREVFGSVKDLSRALFEARRKFR